MTDQDDTLDGYDAAEWKRWCNYSAAIVRLAKLRGAARNQVGAQDRFWWAERDLWRKRRECIGG